MNKINNYFHLITILPLISIVTNERICPNEIDLNSTENVVSWPETTESLYSKNISSTPLCLDQQKFLKTRDCTRAGWSPRKPPECHYTQIAYEMSSKCPPGTIDLTLNKSDDKILCIQIIKPRSWSDECIKWGSAASVLHLDLTELQCVIDYLNNQDIDQYWLPIKSDSNFLPFTWKLPGEIWGDVFDDSDFKYWSFVNNGSGNCLAVSNKNNIISNVDCGEKLPTVCVYNEKSPLLQLACSDGEFTSRYRGYQDKCFKINLAKGREREFAKECNHRYFGLTSIEKTYFYNHLMKELNVKKNYQCRVNINPYSNASEFNFRDWSDVVDSIDFVNWARDFNKEKGIFSTADVHGNWFLWYVYNCTACEEKYDLLEPVMHLRFDAENEFLHLIIYSNEFLWRESDNDPGVTCYTDSDNELLKNVNIKNRIWSERMSVTDLVSHYNVFDRKYVSKTIYELKLYGDGPGHYWCDGLAIPNFHLVESQKIVAYKKLKGTVFAIAATTNCDNCDVVWKRDYTKNMSKHFGEFLENIEIMAEIKNIRVMQINYVPNDLRTKIRILFHVTFSPEYFEDYEEVKMNGNEEEEEEDDDDDDQDSDLTEEILKSFYIKRHLQQRIAAINDSNEFYNISLNHTTFCLPPNPTSKLKAKIGQRAILPGLCLTNNNLPLYINCVGDYLNGGVWLESKLPECQKESIPELTKNLYKIARVSINATNVNSILRNIIELLSNPEELIPADVYMVTRVVKKAVACHKNSTILAIHEIEKIARIFSNAIIMNEKTAKICQMYMNTTNEILDLYDSVLNNILVNMETNEHGILPVITPHIQSYVIDPTVKNITGIALLRQNMSATINRDDLSGFRIKYLYANQSIDELLDMADLEVASFIPLELLKRIDEINQTSVNQNVTAPIIKPPLRIVATIVCNDRLFQENRNITHHKSASRILSISIPGYGPNLPTLLPMLFRTKLDSNNTNDHICGFWNFAPANANNMGEWSNEGCEYISLSSLVTPPIVLCGCSHLTHFTFLLTGTFELNIPADEVLTRDIHNRALDYITVLGCSLSLTGIMGIWITAIVFRTWREKSGTKILLHLSGGIALQMLLFLFVSTEYLSTSLIEDKRITMCIILGATLHYSVLVVFSWTLITAYLQYLRYVIVLGNTVPARFQLKSFIVGWIIPLIPVLTVALLTKNSDYLRNGNLEDVICYPQGNALYFGIILPVGLVVLANLAIFITIIFSITRSMGKTSKPNDGDNQMAQLRLSIFLFFLLGLSWIFGLLSSMNGQGNVLFSYLFCLTATVQGFVLFIYFIIMDPATRKLWRDFLISLSYGKNDKFID